jgi:glutathione S-transferase
MPTIELYDYEAAACPAKVRWALAEEGLRWERHRVDLADFEQKSQAYLRIHPEGVVPAARVDGEAVREASLIMKRVAKATGSGAILPSGPDAEARVDRVLDWVAEFHPSYALLLYAEVFIPMHQGRPPERRALSLANVADPALRERLALLIERGIDAERTMGALAQVETGLARADKALAQSRWLAGDAFTIADIDLFPYVNTPLMLVSDLWAERMPHVERWLRQMRERPAYVEAIVNFPYDTELWAAVLTAPHGGGFRASLSTAA